jgi:stage II sporulation protein M
MKNLIKKLWTDSKQTIFEARYCILIAAILYCGAFLVSWSSPENFLFLNEALKEFVAQFSDKSAITFITRLFIQNLIASYLTMCVVVLFGSLPATVAVFNGFILGFVIASAHSVSASKMMSLLIPHGIFEWPAMMIAWGIGIWRGFGYRFSKTHTTYNERRLEANKVFITVVVPLLSIAAIIEGRYHIIKELFP